MIQLSNVVVDKKDIRSVVDVLKSGHLAQGKVVREFESKFAKLCGTKYAVAVNSGTAALHCALYALGVKPGEEIITTPFTFVASANPILMVGAKAVFADIDEKTYNIDPAKIEQAITKKTRAIIVVNLYGQPADYDEINTIARKYHLKVIEDAAQSINASYKDKKSGNLADIGCFSFYATKNIMSGEGGMITTNYKEFYEKMRMFRHHGQLPEKRYEYIDLGYNYRMTDFVAALALSQLKKLKFITKKRQANAKQYDKAFHNGDGITIPINKADRTHVYHQYVIRVSKDSGISRNELKEELEKKGIATYVHYPKALYEFPHLNSEKIPSSHFPCTNRVTKEILSIPVHPYLTQKQINHIIKSIQR